MGSDVEYVVTVKNTGNAPATNVLLKHEVCQGMKFQSASDDGALEEGYVEWKFDEIEAGDSRSVTVIHKAETIRVTRCEASVTSDNTGAKATSTDACSVDIFGIPAILLEVVDVVDPIEVDEEETYEISITNQGSIASKNVVIKAMLPDQLQFVSSEGPTEATAEGQIVTFDALESIDPEATVVYKIVARTVGVGDIRFRLELTSSKSTEPIIETESTNIYK